MLNTLRHYQTPIGTVVVVIAGALVLSTRIYLVLRPAACTGRLAAIETH